MEINSMLNNGLRGFGNAQRQMVEASEKIAKTSLENGPSDVTEPVVDLLQGELSAKANAKTIETANETLGTLLDIKA